MTKRLLDVGNCSIDHAAIRRLIQHSFADVEVLQADQANDALAMLRSTEFALVVVNRKLDIDYTDGAEVIRQIKADAEVGNTPVMLLSNYPESQAEAMAIGAEPGFGKLAYHEPETLAKLRKYLG